MKLEEITIDGTKGGNISLNKLLGSNKIKDITGYISNEFGEPTFKLSRIILEDDNELWVEGEHDYPYVTEGLKPVNELMPEKLQELYDQYE